MINEQIIEMAKQAGIEWDGVENCSEYRVQFEELQAFAQLVRNETLEWAAQLCDDCCQEQIRSLKS